jgi:hypothetical protein
MTNLVWTTTDEVVEDIVDELQTKFLESQLDVPGITMVSSWEYPVPLYEIPTLIVYIILPRLEKIQPQIHTLII